MLDTDASYKTIIDLCMEYELEISKSALSRYASKRQEALQTGVPLDQILDKRRKTGNVITITPKNTTETIDTLRESSEESVMPTVNKLYSDIEFLDKVILKANRTLDLVDVAEVTSGMRAIDLKSKITGNQLQGLSIVGLRELNIKRMAKESAITEILLKYIPEDMHEQVLREMEEKENEFYANLDLSDEDKRLKEALNSAGIEL